MESLKQEALNVISKMPDTAEIDDIMYGRRDFNSAWDVKDH